MSASTKTLSCRAHMSGSGIRNVGNFCGKPATGEHDGSPRCAYHLGVEARREARRNAPHVHKAWMSGVHTRPDGTMYAFCADCGALMYDTREA